MFFPWTFGPGKDIFLSIGPQKYMNKKSQWCKAAGKDQSFLCASFPPAEISS